MKLEARNIQRRGAETEGHPGRKLVIIRIRRMFPSPCLPITR